MKHINDRRPNFYSDDQFFLIRCYCCGGERGRENYIPTAATGQCAWCGWKEGAENER